MTAPGQADLRPEAVSRPPRDRTRELGFAFAVFLTALTVYNLNLRTISTGDSWSTRFVPFAVLRWGTLNLEGFRNPILQGRANAYWLRELPDGRAASTYPVVTPLVATPIFVPAALWLAQRDWPANRLLPAARAMEKLAASIVAACGVALLFGWLRNRSPPRTALWLTLAYALGTGTWPISSQALWQHALAQLLVILALRSSTSNRPGSTWALGLIAGLLCANRPPDLPLAAGFLLAAVGRSPRAFLPLSLGVFAGGLPSLVYNFVVFGSPMGGYAAFSHSPAGFGLFQGAAAPLAMLASPGKGLFAFSPFLLLLAVPRADQAPRAMPVALSRWLFAALAAQLALFSFVDWDGGACYGPRFLLDGLPILIAALVPVLANAGRALHLLAATLLTLSIGIQYVGAFHYRGASNRALRVHRLGPVVHDPVWRWGLAPPLVEARQPRAAATLIEDLKSAFGTSPRDGASGADRDDDPLDSPRP
jgi:hypothetical protein